VEEFGDGGQVRVDSDLPPVGLLGDLARLAGSLFSLSSPVTDPITRLNATLEGRYVGQSLSEVGLGRLELPTSRLSGVRSNHLSYRPHNNLRLRCAMFC
jgi:hypothetical protein